MDAISTMVQCVGMHTLRRVSTVHIPHSGVRKLPVLSMYFRFVNQRSTVKAANKKIISFVSFENITFIYRAFQV